MRRTSTTGILRRGPSALLISLSLLGAVGCGGEEPEDVQTTESAILGGWKTLSLKNGWLAKDGTVPAVGIVNGVITFKGQLTAPAGQTNPVAFWLDDPKYQPEPLNALYMRVVLNGNVGGTLFYNPFNEGTGRFHTVSIYQDGVNPSGLGSAARTLTSLDGVAFDKSSGDPIDHDDEWNSRYQFRQSEKGCSDCGAYVKLVDGMVRFTGLLAKDNYLDDLGGYLFTLPDAKYIPGNNVTVPLNLGGGSSTQSWDAHHLPGRPGLRERESPCGQQGHVLRRRVVLEDARREHRAAAEHRGRVARLLGAFREGGQVRGRGSFPGRHRLQRTSTTSPQCRRGTGRRRPSSWCRPPTARIPRQSPSTRAAS